MLIFGGNWSVVSCVISRNHKHFRLGEEYLRGQKAQKIPCVARVPTSYYNMTNKLLHILFGFYYFYSLFYKNPKEEETKGWFCASHERNRKGKPATRPPGLVTTPPAKPSPSLDAYPCYKLH